MPKYCFGDAPSFFQQPTDKYELNFTLEVIGRQNEKHQVFLTQKIGDLSRLCVSND